MKKTRTRVETFETLYRQLQEVVARLEAGDLLLEESLRLYEQGVSLAAACQQMLDTAELRVQHIQVSPTVGDTAIPGDSRDNSGDASDE
ncbi:MAG: exodeoxyribonuclease VII small subunit [Chloroflexaceae bacterium]|nr:exodeoxyribonuclease VII small subunit [Chloroflexaceae bacterium]